VLVDDYDMGNPPPIKKKQN